MAANASCSELSLLNGESLAATAGRADNWIVVEYREPFGHDAVRANGLSAEIKAHLRARADALAPAKLLFVRRGRQRGQAGLSAFWGSSPERGGRLFRADLDGYDGLLGLDFASGGEPLDHPLLLVCTNGNHDRCCALHGRPVFEALARAEPGWAWQSSHLGGHRFAGNLVCLPEGLWFGRVGGADAGPLLEEYRAGRIDLARYRGRSCYLPPVQAAERAVREQTGLTGIADLELLSVEPIRFRAGGRDYQVEVEAKPGEPAPQSCGADPVRPEGYAAQIVS